MSTATKPERIQTVVIGGGQSGLSVGYHLKRAGLQFMILEAKLWVGDNWRHGRDSLRLRTPARSNALPGMPIPAPGGSFATKDEMADYLEAYARKFQIPVRTRVCVERLSRRGRRFLVQTNHGTIEAEQVIVATGRCRVPKVPELASRLDPDVLQLHSAEYRRPSQLRRGPVLVVSAGSSGSEVALELARHGHRTILSGRSTEETPSSPPGFAVRWLERIWGRRSEHGGVTTRELTAAGVERVATTAGVHSGMPVLEGGRVLHVANVVWCTGYEPGLSWIDAPLLGALGEPLHDGGVSPKVPGLYFVGFEPAASMRNPLDAAGRVAQVVVEHVRAAAERRAEWRLRVSGPTVFVVKVAS